MNNLIFSNIIRLFILILVQSIILQQIQLGGDSFNYISLFIYPLFLLLLPLKTSKISLVLIGFGLGLIIDVFYNSPGVHAGATLFTAVMRPAILNIWEPREGYNVNHGLTIRNYGFNWFLKYAGSMFFIHLLIYFILEIFTPVYSMEIFLRTLFSFLFSMVLVFIYMFLFTPKD